MCAPRVVAVVVLASEALGNRHTQSRSQFACCCNSIPMYTCLPTTLVGADMSTRSMTNGLATAPHACLHLKAHAQVPRIARSRLLVPSGHAQLANMLSSEALFYTCIIPFIIFFGSFAALMYPNKDYLHPTGERPCFASRALVAVSWHACALDVLAY